MEYKFEVKKGRFEKNVDKVMLISLAIIVTLIIVLLVIAYFTYAVNMNQLHNNILYGRDPNSPYEKLVDEKGNILVNDKSLTLEEMSSDISFNSFLNIGWTVLNRNIIFLKSNPDSVFRNNNIIIISCVLFFCYWLVLLYLFEKERGDDISVSNLTDEEIMDKYNPLIAGCLEGNRNVAHSDLVAVLLGMINKKIIDLRLEPIKDEEKLYNYILVRNRSNELKGNMDEVESYVHSWIFGENILTLNEINLIDAINNIMQDSNYEQKMKHLNKLAKKKLNKIGANKDKVPKIIRVLNCLVFVFVAIISLVAAFIGLVNINIGAMDIVLFYFAIILFGYAIPLLIFLIYIGVFSIMQLTRFGKILFSKLGSREVVGASILIFLSLITLIFFTIHFSINVGIIPYEILLGITFLIMKTDNLMIQNDEEINSDYNRLKLLKDKLKNYSLLDQREIEEVALWDKYLTYAVAFGVARNIIKETDINMQPIKIEMSYLIKLIFDTINGFLEVNF